MGLGRRMFLVSDDDALQHVAIARYDTLRHGDERIRELAGRKVRDVLVLFECTNRRPTKVVYVECGYLQFDKKGRVGRAVEWDKLCAAVELVGAATEEPYTTGVINARHRFLRRQFDHKYHWEPSAAILEQIGKSLFR